MLEQQRMTPRFDFGAWEWLLSVIMGWSFDITDGAAIEPNG